MNTCVSDFALDDFEIHGSKLADVEAHLHGCDRCQGRRRERARAVAHFRERWADGVWQQVVGRQAVRRARPRWRFAVPALALGLGAAAVLLVAVPRDRSYVGTKGRAAAAEVFCHRGERTFALAPGDEVLPGDQLRFRPLPAWPAARYIQIGSVDGTGAFTPFYPADGRGLSVPLPAEGQPLPGSIRLDDAPGPERLLIVLSERSLPAEDVRRAALASAAQGSELRRIGDVEVAATWIVLPKRAARGP